jgi:hypothetical protein
MKQPGKAEFSPRVEGALAQLFAAGDPRPDFVAGLERQLLAQANESRQATVARDPGGCQSRNALVFLFQRRWVQAAVVLLLAIALAITAIGPQRVLADILRLFGYVPGIGFANLEKTRVLVAPVEVTRDGVTLRVLQVVAGPDRTQVVIRSEGLPREDQLRPAGASLSPHDLEFAGWLRLPDGSTVAPRGYTLRWGGGSLEFPALPTDVYTATLELTRLPLVPARAAPENWQIALALQPATGPLVTALFPQPYRPAAPADTHHDITISVEQVAHTADETVLKLRGTWQNREWEIMSLDGGVYLPALRDDVGHVYGWAPSSSSGSAVLREVVRIPEPTAGPTPVPQPPGVEREFAFAPLSALAHELTLEIEGIEAQEPASGSFHVTIPEGAQVGDRWPLDIHLGVAGFPVHITSVRLYEETLRLPEGPMQRTVLGFDVAEVPDQDGETLAIFYIDSPSPAFQSGPGSRNMGEHKMGVSLALKPGAQLPSGRVDVTIRGASIVLHGPWRVGWPIPGRGGAALAPVPLQPAGATDTHNGLTLRLLELTHTDRLSALDVDLQGAPAGVQLGQVRFWNARTGRNEVYLEDDRGRRIEYGSTNTRWLRPDEPTFQAYRPQAGAQSLVLPPVDPLARRLTLSLPAIDVIRPGSGSFDVTVPAGIGLKTQPNDRPRASDPWELSIALQVAGFEARFTHAQLVELRDSVWLMLSPALGSGPAGGPVLAGLCSPHFASPSGRDARSGKDIAIAEGGPCAANPAFEVLDPASGRIESGVYLVTFTGIAETVPGPWRLSWEIPER